ncbi:ankyrin repeat domain-containing protein [Mannheimia sp. AT1]|uniref:Ankyrin repeat domain-containing protein n=1 Tax=Mannheimia cairinae TaxID=3025936 RepID=A0ABT5MS50_9PAST|nr:ankyrin repeat domain-containing protein [Mannheimia cairinae]MDD0824286.1 ankyrin repeat domain-containing protein [Mannheimia cairinae]MDD0826591.1 ankyrin repeat domain-containing protein [Mannheimia cairinae]
MNEELFEAVALGNKEKVNMLLAKGADINAQDKGKRTPILIAAQHNHLDLVRFLAEQGADINAQDNKSFNPFIHGCIFNKLELVKLMVKLGTDITRLTRFGGNGLTPAAEKGHEEIVKYLLENTDINVNLTNNVGWTALIEAIILNDGGEKMQRIIRLLLENGADPTMTDEWGVPPIELARRKGYQEIVSIIEEYL